MSFWKESGYSYAKIVEMPERELSLLVNDMTRKDIQEWLIWNDPNGIYGDAQSLKELGNVLSREEGLRILLRQVKENRTIG